MPARPVPDMEKKIEAALEIIADGNSVRFACEKAGISKTTFLKHADKDQYARARDACADSLYWDLLDLAKSYRKIDKDQVPGARLDFDAERWILSKMKPAAYGDKVGVELTGKDGGPMQYQDMSQLTDEQLQAILAQGTTE